MRGLLTDDADPLGHSGGCVLFWAEGRVQRSVASPGPEPGSDGRSKAGPEQGGQQRAGGRGVGKGGGNGGKGMKAAGNRPRREGQALPSILQVSVSVWVPSRCGLIVPGLKSRIGFHLAGFSGLMRGRNAPRRGRSSDLPGLTTVGPAPIRALLSFSVGSSAFLPSAITRSSTSPIQVPTQPPLCAHLHNCTAHETAV